MIDRTLPILGRQLSLKFRKWDMRRVAIGGVGGCSTMLALVLASLSAAAASWTVVPSADSATSETNALNGIACESTTDCWSVGYHAAGSVNQTLIERRASGGWVIVASPDTGPADSNVLYSVACPAAGDCWAVGYDFFSPGIEHTLIEHFDGTSWAIVSSPNPAGTIGAALVGVSCATVSDCDAVGNTYDSTDGVYVTLTEHYDGTAWSLVTSPNPSTSQNSQLLGVSCAAGTCWAVGETYSSGNTSAQTLVEENTGSGWSIVSSPNPTLAPTAYLNSVSCTGPDECWAVGASTQNTQTLIEHETGGSWAIVSSPNTLNAFNFLTGVACMDSIDCWAVGVSNAGPPNNIYQTLIEEYSGAGWTVIGSPDTSSAQANVLNGVACAGTAFCAAAGYSAPSVDQTLIEEYEEPAAVTPDVPWTPAVALAGLALAATAIRWRRTRPGVRGAAG
jgi:hypothetical protein